MEGPVMQADLLAQLAKQLAEARARIAELEAQVDRQCKNLGNLYDAIKNVGGDPCEFSQAIYKLGDHIQQLESTLAACKDAGFIDEGGKVRRVVGKTPITADGCLLGLGGNFYFNGGNVIVAAGVLELLVDDAGDVVVSYRDTDGEEDVIYAHQCYSTREAAEAARTEKQ